MPMKKTLQKRRAAACLILLLTSLVPVPSAAANSWPTIALEPVVTSGLQAPVFLTHAGDNSGRLFIVERPGRIRIWANATLQTTPFLDITDRVRSTSTGGGSEEGLLSVAFPPDYASKGYFYIYYTRSDGNNNLARFHVSNNPDLADPNSEELILLFNHPIQQNHNGGLITFGPDGYLYIGTGDGGGGGDPYDNAQNTNSLLGKILRIEVEPELPPLPSDPQTIYLPLLGQSDSPAPRYKIPSTNPFINQVGYRPEIWALGLRNPWRYSFDSQTNDLYIADVGQGSWEEINFQAASSTGGENYGWPIMEGAHCYNSATCDQTGLVLPVNEYSHADGCSITGGYVYRGAAYPSLQGIYYYADYCYGKIWGVQWDGSAWQSILLLDSPYNISSFGLDAAGELYLLDMSGGVYRVKPAP